MKMGIRVMALSLAWVIGGAIAASATPKPNAQGDYPIPAERQRGGRQVNWQVVDPDPAGLKCRMTERFQKFSVDATNAPAELFQRKKHNISQWTAIASFRKGQRLQAVTGNLANQIVLVDQQGKPWLPVSLNKAKGTNCVVRANSRFIKPIRENSTTLKPLE
jgi:hypothetical protein